MMALQQKRSAAEADSLLDGKKAIVFDFEGTLAPITFGKEMVNYVQNNVETHLSQTFEDAETIKDVAALRELSQKECGVEGAVQIPDAGDGKEKVIKAVVESVQWQIEKERDSTELKQFQNHVLRHAYEFGDLKAELFDDVPPMLRMLSEEGFTLFVFSSESVESLKLHLHNTTDEGLFDVFSGFFDTTIGSRTDPETYKKIAAEIKFPAKEILFLTDVPEEAAAAVKVDWSSVLIIRPGNDDLKDEHLYNFACIEQLDELYGDEDEEEDLKRFHGDDNEEVDEDEDDDENEDDVDEDEEGEEEEGEDV